MLESESSNSFRVFAGQRRLIEDTTKSEHAYIAGLGGGKTTCGVRWDFRRVCDNEDSAESIVVAPNYRLLKNRCLAEYDLFLQHIGLRKGRNGDYTINQSSSDMKIVFARGHTIHFLSGAAPENIVSYNASHIWIDEPAIMSELVVQKVIERLRCPKARYRQILFTGTPEGLNWFFERFHPNKVPRIEGTKFSESDTRLILHGSTYDNRTLPEDYFRRLEEQYSWDENLYKNYVLGEWVDLSRDRFYYAFSESRHVGDYPPDSSVFQLYLSFDNNVGKFAWAALQPQFSGGVAVVKANAADASNALVACEQVIRAFPPEIWGNHIVTVYGDAVLYQRSREIHGTTFDLIRSLLKPYYPRLEVRARRQNPAIHDRSLCTNMFFGQNRLHIDRRLSAVILSARATKQAKNGEIEKSKDDNVTHLMEAVDRVLMALDPPKIKRQFAA